MEGIKYKFIISNNFVPYMTSMLHIYYIFKNKHYNKKYKITHIKIARIAITL